MRTYLGIDFGTSNTHVAYCNDLGEGPLTAVPIKFAGRPSIATCVLWGNPADGSLDDRLRHGRGRIVRMVQHHRHQTVPPAQEPGQVEDFRAALPAAGAFPLVVDEDVIPTRVKADSSRGEGGFP